MLGPGAAKFPSFPPLAPGMGFVPPAVGLPASSGMLLPPRPGMPAATAAAPVSLPGMAVAPGLAPMAMPGMNGLQSAAKAAPATRTKPQDVLLLIRQGVANQDKAGVKTALQLAHQLGTPIDPPILAMLKTWLGEDAFAAVMPKSAPTPGGAPAVIPAKAPPLETGAKAKAAVPVPTQPPLVLIREGVAKQDKGIVRAALRMAVEQGTPIDAPVLDMLRKWLSEEDESLNLLAARAGMPSPEPKASQEALSVSTAKAAATGPVVVSPRVHLQKAPAASPASGPGQGEGGGSATAPAGSPPAEALKEQTVKASPPQKRPPPQPVIQRGPQLKNAPAAAAAAPPPQAPDLDASFDAFLQELGTTGEGAAEASEEPAPDSEPASKRRKVPEADEADAAPPPPDEEQPPPPPEPVKKPPMRAPPEKPKKSGPTKDEWGREIAEEDAPEEKEAWQYIAEAQAASKASVWGAGNFVDFNSFK